MREFEVTYPPMPPDPAATATDAAALRLATKTRHSQHGQRCPVWVHRRSPSVSIDACDCWILRNARRDVMIVLTEAHEWEEIHG